MSRVLTPNVFITNNAGIAKDFFLSNKFTTSEELPEVPGALLISGKQNKYLVSLDYSVNFDNENNPSLTLEFVDTDGQFEQTMFMHLTNVLKGSLQSLFRKDSAKKQINTSGTNSLVIKDGKLAVDENELTAIEQYSHNYKRIYVAFGTDNLLSNWSDLLAFYLQKTTVDVSNGLRRYIFKFYASNDAIFRPKLQFNFQNPNYIREFLYLESLDRLLVTVPKSTRVDTLENVLYRLMVNYLSIMTSTPKQNIIGIIPSFEDYDVSGSDIRRSAFKKLYINNNIDKLGIKEVNQNVAFNLASEGLQSPQGAKQAARNGNVVDLIVEQSASTSTLDSYMLLCQEKDGSINPAFPNFYDAINKIDKGIKSILGTTDDFIILQENNIKLIEFWKKKGLISGSLDKCIVFGPQQMISEYLYRNYIGEFSESKGTPEDYLRTLSKDFKGTLPIYDPNDKLYSNTGNVNNNVARILLDPQYGLDLIMTTSKQKISSNFYEQINLDEFALGNQENQKFVDLFKTRAGIFQLFEIPVFLNNFTNSNILNIQFQNSEVYLQGLSLAIESNFSKAYLAALANNVNKVNIQGLNLSSVFDSYAKLLNSITGTTFEIEGKKVGIKEALKAVLIQQFYLAKINNINLELDISNVILDDSRTTDNYDRSIKVITRQNIFTQLKNIKPRTASFTEEVIETITGGSRSRLRARIAQDIENEIQKNTGFKIISPEIVEEVLNYFESINSVNFDNLIYKHQGNINVDYLLFSIAASNLDSNQKRSLPSELLKKYPNNKTVDYNLDTIGFEISKQEAYFNLANAMFSIFDIKTLDDNTKDIPEGMVFKPKNFGLSQENIASELWKSLNAQHVILNIKTLPFFHMSSLRMINFKPCFVFSKQVTPVNINSTSNPTNLDFFSGVYNITAFKHVITTKECYSQFALAKNLGNSYAL